METKQRLTRERARETLRKYEDVILDTLLDGHRAEIIPVGYDIKVMTVQRKYINLKQTGGIENVVDEKTTV